MKNGYSYRLSLRVFRDGEKLFGPGIAQLLTLVEQNQSLRAAAMEMDMAYSKAWRVVREAERLLGEPLLITMIGGRRGGGAMLTHTAKSLLTRYQAFELQAREAVDAVFERNFADI